MLHRCCKPIRIEAELGAYRVALDVSERIAEYRYSLVDPLPAALRGRGSLRVTLACTTACLSNSLGPLGEALREATGSSAIVVYVRRGGRDARWIEGFEASLEARDGRVSLRGLRARLQDVLEKCLLGGAKLVAPRIEEMLEKGIEVGEGSLLDYGSALLSIASTSIVRDAVEVVNVDVGCAEEIVSSIVYGGLGPLTAAAVAVADQIGRSIVVYPVAPDALAPSRGPLTHEKRFNGRAVGRVIR